MPDAPEIEAWLKSHKVKWEHVPALALERIDQPASLANQARLEPLDVEVVNRYKQAIIEGDVMPPVVVWRRSRKAGDQLVTLGGNHRTHAHALAGVKTIDAYVVECSASLATVLMYEDNRRHGLPPSQSERVQQAKHLVASSRMTVKRAAAIVGVSPGSVQIALQTDEVDRRARKLRLDLSHLSASTRFRLAAVRDDKAFVELGELASDARMNKADLDKIVPALNRLGSSGERIAYLAAERKRWAERIRTVVAGGTKAGPGRKPQRIRFHDAVGEILNLDPDLVWDDIARESPEYFKNRCKAAVVKLIRLAKHAEANR